MLGNLPSQTRQTTPAVSRIERVMKEGRPDWDAIDFDVLCSRCDYNLRTLTRPRCPECGLEFQWPEVLGRIVNRSEFCLNIIGRPVRSAPGF